jgi:hypothetical protein
MALRNSQWSGALLTKSSISAPVSQMSAAAPPAGTEQLALVAALFQRSGDAGTSWLGMPSIRFEHESKVLPDEF